MLNRRLTLVLAYLSGPLAATAVLALVVMPELPQLPGFPEGMASYLALSALPGLTLGLGHLLLSRLFRAPASRASLNKAMVLTLLLQALALAGLDLTRLTHPDLPSTQALLAGGPVLLAAASFVLILFAFSGFSLARRRA